MTQFYDQKYPSVGELVTVEHVEIDCAGGVKCELLEYGRISAFMPVTEISRKRVHSVSRQIKLGKNQACFVINVDEKKGYVDVSMKDITPEDKVECNTKYKNAKLVYDIFNPLVDYVLFIHPMYAQGLDVHHILQFTPEKFSLEPPQMEMLMKQHSKLFVLKQNKVTAQINVSSNNGQLDDLKIALMAGLVIPDVSVKLIASPLWLVFVEDIDNNVAIHKVEQALENIEKKCVEMNCKFLIKKQPAIQE